MHQNFVCDEECLRMCAFLCACCLQRGKNRFFSASAEDTTFGGSTNSNLSPAGPNSNSQDASQTNASSANTPTAGPGSAPVSAAKKRSLLSLSSPKYYQRQSRHPSGVISHEGSLKVKNATKQHRWSSLFTTSVKARDFPFLFTHVNCFLFLSRSFCL